MSKKKKPKLPREVWYIKPIVKVKESAKLYNRKKIQKEED